MTTVVCVPAGKVRRPLHPDMFADMATGPAVFGGGPTVLEVTIPAVLTPGQTRTARLRLSTVDDAEADALLAAAAAVEAVQVPPSVESLAAAVDALAALVLPDYLLEEG